MNEILQEKLNQPMINIIGNYTNEFKSINVVIYSEIIENAAKMGREMFGYFLEFNYLFFDRIIRKLSIIHKIWCIRNNKKYFFILNTFFPHKLDKTDFLYN